MPGPVTYANPQVLEFYRELPFNIHGSDAEQAEMIRRRNAAEAYPVLAPLIGAGTKVLEVGSGVGWLSLSVSLHYGGDVTAIDFNPVAIDRARAMARLTGQDIDFQVADLFLYEPEQPADLVLSVGVLHHTDNCLGAVERLCTRFVRDGGHVFIGLYHTYGRRPFLQRFERMKARGYTEEAMFEEYRRLHSALEDDTFARSWFRDQVLHPHETQHTLEELMPVLERSGMTLKSTSINGFRPIGSLEDLFDQEKEMEHAGRIALAREEYYPGFFLVLAQKGSS